MSLRGLINTLLGKKILLYADFIDPFCYVGFHTLRPLAEARGIELDWRGFEMNPGTPPEGLTLTPAGNSDLRPGMWASVQGLIRHAGLDFPEPRWIPNTQNAQILIQQVKNPAVKNPLIERIYQAYFTGQKDISQTNVLIDLATAFEIPSESLWNAWKDPRWVKQLEQHREEAQRRQFLGLPGFIYRGNNHFGALSREAWEKILGTRP